MTNDRRAVPDLWGGLVIHVGDCLDVLAGMEPASVDSIVTDPPAAIGFMSKSWDHDRGGRDKWVGWMTEVMRECYRVLKPGHWMLCWAIPRRQHWTAWAIEEAGFYITDVVLHCFASGFPKGRTQLKPAYEPWVLARKPGPLRELAIDACRIGFASDADREDNAAKVSKNPTGVAGLYGVPGVATHNPAGRWPANVILTDPIFDGGWDGVVGGGTVTSGVPGVMRAGVNNGAAYGAESREPGTLMTGYGDTGTYSRFFLVPKAGRAEREPAILPEGHDRSKRFTSHPTVKPVELMRHLVRLVTPPGGVCLDPFLGSGSTAIAAELEGFRWIGIEREEEYVRQAEARLQGVQRGLGLDVAAPRPRRIPGESLEQKQARGLGPDEIGPGNFFGGIRPTKDVA